MTYLRWIKQRFVFLKRVLITLFDRLIYQKQSQFLLHRTNAHRCPYDAILFYNTLGRTLFMFKEFIALVTKNKIFKKSITLDSFDDLDYKELYSRGSHNALYPKSPMIQVENPEISDAFYEKIANSFILAYQHDNEKDISNEWERISAEFRELFFDKHNNIIKENLANFRGDPKIYEKIFNNQYSHLSQKNTYNKSYLDAVDLVLEYHRYASKIDKEILASVSESTAGNYKSINYRGKKLSEQLLQNLVVANDIIKYVPFSTEKQNVILDIGVGFGGSSRILNYYTPKNTTQILLDLPETLFLTAYYLKYNFPNKKIALLEDIYPHLDNLDGIIDEYDFIIIPPFILDHLKDASIDLVINASSLAFMPNEYLNYYLEHTKRLLKEDGYFYSLNTSEDSEWGTGSYAWDYKADYLTTMYNYDNRFAYPQWLGKKL